MNVLTDIAIKTLITIYSNGFIGGFALLHLYNEYDIGKPDDIKTVLQAGKASNRKNIYTLEPRNKMNNLVRSPKSI
jgi:hypothetical protein